MKTWSAMQDATDAEILAWAESQPWARHMAACPQDPHWHAEGDVWTHTRMVCAELQQAVGALRGIGSLRADFTQTDTPGTASPAC